MILFSCILLFAFANHSQAAVAPNTFKSFLQEMMVKNNTYLGAILAQEAAKEREYGTFGLYMPNLTASLTKDTTYNKLSLAETETRAQTYGFEGKIPQLGLNYSSTLYKDTKTVKPEPVTYAGTYSYSLSLNLLKDFGPYVGDIPFRQAEYTYDLAYYNQIKTVYSIFSELLSAYSSALNAQKNLMITQDSLKRTEEELRKSNEQYKVGKIPKLSLLALEAQSQQVQSQVIGQERSLREAFKSLYTLSSIDTDVENSYTEGLEALPPMFDQKVIDDLAIKDINFETLKNPDYLNAKVTMERAKLTLKLARNGVLPTLALAYTYNGSKSDYREKSHWFPSEQEGKTIALTFSMPLGLYTERHELAASKKEYQLAELTFDQTKRELKRTWDNLVQQYSLLKRQVDIARELVKAAKEKFEASMPTGQLGSTYQQNVISFQNEWVNAQVSLNQLEVELLQTQLRVLSFHADKHLIHVLNKYK